MKIIKGYLILTSIIFHLILVGSLLWVIPLYNDAVDTAESMVESFEQEDLATVIDNSELTRGSLTYKGYLVEFKGRNLYLPGSVADNIEIGDQVQLITYEHWRFGTPNLMAFAIKKDL